MIQAPTDLQIEKIEQKQNDDGIFVNFVTISFVPPAHPSLAGYKLYFSFDNFANYYLSYHLDNEVVKEGERVFIERELIELCDGRTVWFRAKAFTTYNEESDFSDSVSTMMKASIPVLKKLFFDTKKVYVEVEDIPKDSGKNSEFVGFRFYREELSPVTYSVLSQTNENVVLQSNDFVEGKTVFVKHYARNVIWKGIVSEEGYFTLEKGSESIYDIALDYTKISQGDLNIFVEKGNFDLLVETTSTGIYDFNVKEDKVYLYSVVSVTPGQESLASKGTVEVLNLVRIIPVLRRLEQSNPNVLTEYWKRMKDSLHDENYYLKGTFDIPYTVKDYLFLVYVGITNIDVDVWLNDEFIGTFPTDENGESSFSLSLRKGENVLKFRLKNYDKTIHHPNDFVYNLNSLLMYLFFLAFGILIKGLEDDLQKAEDNSFVYTCESSILDKFATLVGIYKVYGWTTEEYRGIIQKLLLAFSYSGTVKGIEDVISAFSVVDRFEIYEFLEPWRTIRVGDFLTSTGYITNENFVYGVSSCKNNGEETIPALVRVDKRWHDPIYRTVNIFEWKPVDGADFYKIYRGTSSLTMGFLTSTGGTRFIDYNTRTPDYSKVPLTLQYASINPPREIKRLFVRRVRENEFYYYSGAFLKIIVFGKRDFYENEKELIYQTVRRVIPAELKLEMIFADVSGVSEMEGGYGYNYGFDYGVGL